MKLTRISLIDWKGVSDAFAIDKCNLLVGPNGSGKSAVLSAPQFAITGKSVCGDRPEATMQLGADSGCAVNIDLDDGFCWQRGITVDHRTHSHSTYVVVAGNSGLGVRESDAMVREHVGDFAPMFRLGHFLDLSDDKRRDFVLDLCSKSHSGGAVNVDFIINRMLMEFTKSYLGLGQVASWADDHLGQDESAFVVSLLEQLQRDVGECANVAVPQIRGVLRGNLTDSLIAALNKARELTNASKKAKDEARQASRKLSEERATLQVVAESVKAMRERRDTLETEANKIIDQIAHQRGRESSIEISEKSLDELADEIRNGEQRLAESNELRVDLTKAEQLKREVAELQIDPWPEMPAERKKAREVEIETQQKLCNATQAQHATSTALKEFQNNSWGMLNELLASFEAAGALNKDHRPAWVAIKAFVQERIPSGNLDSLEAASEHNAQEVSECERSTREAHEECQKIADRCDRTISIQTEIGSLQTQADAIRVRHDKWETERQRLQGRLDVFNDSRLKTEKVLNDLRAEGGFIPFDALETQQRGITNERRELDARIDAKTRFLALDEELAKCTASAEREAVMWEVCKRLADAIRVLRESLMAELVSPLIDKMNRFLSVGAPGRAAYCRLCNDKGKAVFDLGWIVDEQHRRSFPALSGGEQAMFGAALAYALVCLSDAPLKLLLIESAEVDYQNWLLLLNALAAVQDDVSNILVACHAHSWVEADDDWKTINFWPEEAVA